MFLSALFKLHLKKLNQNQYLAGGLFFINRSLLTLIEISPVCTVLQLLHDTLPLQLRAEVNLQSQLVLPDFTCLGQIWHFTVRAHSSLVSSLALSDFCRPTSYLPGALPGVAGRRAGFTRHVKGCIFSTADSSSCPPPPRLALSGVWEAPTAQHPELDGLVSPARICEGSRRICTYAAN